MIVMFAVMNCSYVRDLRPEFIEPIDFHSYHSHYQTNPKREILETQGEIDGVCA